MRAVCISRCPGLPKDGSQPHRQGGVGRGGWQKSVLRSVQRENSPSGRGGWRRWGGKHTNHSDRDGLPTVAPSIQYSWKCDTFLPRWMALTQEAVLSTSTGCSFQSIIGFPLPTPPPQKNKIKKKKRKGMRLVKGGRDVSRPV